jgi:aminopeptidase N
MPVAEITREETAERARLLEVQSHDIWLDLTRGERLFGSVAEISFSCAEPGATSYADLVAETVHEITLNGQPVDPGTAWADGRIALPPLAATNVLRVVADCRYTSESSGLHRSQDSADDRVYLYTCFEPADARTMFANFEQPDLKAAFTFHVTAPAHWVVLSNQPSPEPVAGQNDGTAVWHFEPTPRISTYLTAIVAGEYHLVSSSYTTVTGQVVPLGLACRQSLAEFLEPEDMFLTTSQGLDFYAQLFGIDYPFAKYDQVIVPEFFGGAVENVGCVVMSEMLLFRSKVTDMMYELRTIVILHELAHMWFGNLVTMRWWDDLWLNESFAEFIATMATAEATRFTGAWTTFSNARKAWGYQQDRMPTTHAVATDVGTVTEAVANFDGISYAKGASVLKQLAALTGREAFLTAISAYLTEHSWANARLADLLTALQASSGRDLAEWSRAWLQTAGPNTLRPEFETSPDGTFRSFAVLQEAPVDHQVLRPHHIAIGLYSCHDGAVSRDKRVEVDVVGARTEVPELVGAAQPDLVLLNDDDLGYALVRFDPRSLVTVTERIGDFTDSLARAVCWSAALDMAQQAEMPVPAFVRMVAGGMAAEPSVSVLQILHRAAAQLLRGMADPAWVPQARQQLAAEAARLLQIAEPGSDHQLAWAELLSWSASSADQLDLIAGVLDGSVSAPGLVVGTELRWALLARLAATGRAGDEQIAAELRRDDTDTGRRHATACRAAMPDAGQKAAAWALLTEEENVGFETMTEVALAFTQPEQAALLEPYAERYFEVLPALWSDRSQMLRLSLGQMIFPITAAGPELLSRIDAFLAEQDRDPGMVRLLAERRDLVERALRSRALPS